jgi:hypothetical protein
VRYFEPERYFEPARLGTEALAAENSRIDVRLVARVGATALDQFGL